MRKAGPIVLILFGLLVASPFLEDMQNLQIDNPKTSLFAFLASLPFIGYGVYTLVIRDSIR